MIYADIPSIQKQTTEESTLASLSLDTLHEESKDNPINVYVALTSPVNLVTPANTPSSEVVVSFIQKKNKISNYRTLDIVICER
jgi:hypothetical protein